MLARRRFSAVGFSLGLVLSLVAGAAIFLLQYVAVSLGERPLLRGAEALTFAAVFLVAGLWQGYRHRHAFGLAAIRFRKRLRRRQWVELFGFAVAISIFGALLGLATAIPKWLPPAAENAGELTIVFAAMGAFAGFVGGFGVQFTPVRRRASR